MIQQEASRDSFHYSRGTDLKLRFDSSKKHPAVNTTSLPQVMSALKLDGYGWQ